MPAAAASSGKRRAKRRRAQRGHGGRDEEGGRGHDGDGGGLSLAPLWVFLTVGVAVLAWGAMAPLQTARERGQAELYRSRVAVAAGDWAAGAGHLQAAAGLGVPLDADELNSLGVCWMKLNRTRDAAGAFRRAVDLQPESFDALRNLAHILRTTDQVEDAALLYGQIVELYDVCEAHKSHGKVSTAAVDPATGDHGSAGGDHDRAGAGGGAGVAGASGRSDGSEGSGDGFGGDTVAETRPEVCEAMASDTAARDSFRAAVREALFYGAEILRTELNRTEAALHQLRRLVKIDPDNPRAVAALAEMLLNVSINSDSSSSNSSNSSIINNSDNNNTRNNNNSVPASSAAAAAAAAGAIATASSGTAATPAIGDANGVTGAGSGGGSGDDSGGGSGDQAKGGWSLGASLRAQAVALLRRCATLADKTGGDFHKQAAVLRCQWLYARTALRDAEAVAVSAASQTDGDDGDDAGVRASAAAATAAEAVGGLREGTAVLRSVVRAQAAASPEQFAEGVRGAEELAELQRLVARFLPSTAIP